MRKILFAGLLFGLFLTACIDSDYPFLDGQWQLKTIAEDGMEQKVDTIFYSFMFKRDVFSYLILTTPNNYSAFYGYIESVTDEELVLNMDGGSFNSYFMSLSDWREKERRFEVLKMNSKEMVLFNDNKTYSFKKH